MTFLKDVELMVYDLTNSIRKEMACLFYPGHQRLVRPVKAL